jgi:nucleotide-binding universal stress UspA family protein
MMDRFKTSKPSPGLKFPALGRTAHDQVSEGRAGTLSSFCGQLPDLGLRRILVPFTFSDSSALLLRRLVPLAESTGAALHLLHVIEPASAKNATGWNARWAKDTMADASQQTLNLWRDRIVRGRVAAYTRVSVGRRVDEIISRAENLATELIVMSTHGYSGISDLFLRSTAEQVTRHAPCPVLTLPERTLRERWPDYDGFPPSAWKRVLMPVDFSRRASRALKYASTLAIANQAKLVLLNIVLEGSICSGTPTTKGMPDSGQLEGVLEKRLRNWVSGELSFPLAFESAIWVGMPSAYAVLLEAQRAEIDLIVMPSRRAATERRFPVGIVKDAILRNALCPILSIHEEVRRPQR